MPSAKDIRLKPISSAQAREVITTHHYSGKSIQKSQLHIGVFLGASLEGAMQFGPPMDRRKLMPLVEGTRWENFMELNRMAFSDRLPPNSESRALGVASRLLRRHAPQVKWFVSFADATQCGDGTIYRAAGLKLTGIKPSGNLARLPDGTTVHKMTLESSPNAPRRELGGRSFYDVTGGRYDFAEYLRVAGGEVLPGFQLRYVKFIDPTWEPRLTVPVLPYSEIIKRGASMYRGEKPAADGADGP